MLCRTVVVCFLEYYLGTDIIVFFFLSKTERVIIKWGDCSGKNLGNYCDEGKGGGGRELVLKN